ncbi:MAG: tRNA lysidine(34) synthetase TilS, partial [Ignavibacteriales bacterium]|nr:tRNA lysidine(34) synthetase TilS [Ignavibacteriales bacterium]
GDTVLLAVSGGIDSMVMMRLFCALREEWNLKLHVVHVNHQLRGEQSIGDELFVQTAAKALAIPFHCKRVKTLQYKKDEHLSKQEAARELRYQFFEETRANVSAISVATAHNADDNAETVLMNALRGAGVRGLSGIPVRREQGNIIRPLLFAHRSEIEEYAGQNNIEFRYDSSNDSLEYKRNYLRNKVIPLLKAEIHPEIVSSLNRVSLVMRQLDEQIQKEVRSRWNTFCRTDANGQTILTIPALLAQPSFLQEEIIATLLRRAEIELTADKVLSILQLCSHPTGHSLQLSGSIIVYRDRENLVFTKAQHPHSFTQAVSVGSAYTFEGFQFSLSGPIEAPTKFGEEKGVEFVDAQKLGAHLILRNWNNGDWFIPLGMHSRKKLSDFFIDEKVPLYEKTEIPVLESEGNIVWICGKRLDERFKVTTTTRAVVRLRYSSATNVH